MEPDFQGTTTKVSEVGGEFVKLYKMIFAEKEIAGEEWLLEGLKEHRLVKSSRQMLDEPFTVNEVAEVMQNLTVGKQSRPQQDTLRDVQAHDETVRETIRGHD